MRRSYKISALEIERVMLEHPDIADCAIVGVADPTGVFGENICMMAQLRPNSKPLSLKELNAWAKSRTASYKLPRQLIVQELPRNVLGKVNKKELRKFFASSLNR